ncbi:MAG TPA: response regulator transcription factor [Bryobacteraceae bacterium]|nr:response regulator transcription factor [Bryobacteraceae bacterium]
MLRTKPRVLIADDHPLIVEGLRTILAPDFEIIATVTDGVSLVTQAELLKPDIILLDIGMPLLNGMDAARRVRNVSPLARIVFVTQRTDREYVQSAFRSGASAYVVKQAAAGELVTALHEVMAGRYYVSPMVRNGISEELLHAKRNPGDLFAGGLTARQREVLQLVAEGKAAKEIAALLDISVKTVEYHKAGIMETLGLRSIAELTRYAIEHGMLTYQPFGQP